jgi:hypothetical protein
LVDCQDQVAVRVEFENGWVALVGLVAFGHDDGSVGLQDLETSCPGDAYLVSKNAE